MQIAVPPHLRCALHLNEHLSIKHYNKDQCQPYIYALSCEWNRPKFRTVLWTLMTNWEHEHYVKWFEEKHKQGGTSRSCIFPRLHLLFWASSLPSWQTRRPVLEITDWELVTDMASGGEQSEYMSSLTRSHLCFFFLHSLFFLAYTNNLCLIIYKYKILRLKIWSWQQQFTSYDWMAVKHRIALDKREMTQVELTGDGISADTMWKNY